MADLTEYTESPVVQAIYAYHKARGDSEPGRSYLGASIIGDECWRKLYYGFRWCAKPEFDGRMYRLFQTGHMAEPRFVAELRAIGCEVWEVDPATGRQFGFASLGGHLRGHCDGVVKNVPGGGAKPHISEYKTSGAKAFADLKKNGVEKAQPKHFAQVQWYMGKAGLERALYVSVNKDTDELYAERVKFDPVAFEKIEAKAAAIIFASEPPAKLSQDQKFYQCNWCDAKPVCHGNRVPPVSCRTCVHSTPERTPTENGDGRWSCAKWGSDIPLEYQRTGCPAHLPLPFLVTYADPVDAGDGWIEFKRKDNGLAFLVATNKDAIPAEVISQYATVPPIYTSAELSAAADHRAICDPGVEELRAAFDARITG